MEMESKIEGLMIATAKVAWMDAEKKADSGYQFAPTKSGFEIKVEQAVLDKHSVAMDAIHDCVKQLEEMSEEELKKAVGYRPDQGPLNTGLVIVSKVDPRVSASVTIGDANDKTVDLVIQWYVAQPQDTAREVKDDELKHVEQLQKETPEMEMDEIEKILGLDMKAESTTLVDKIKTTKAVSNDLDSYGLQLEEEFNFPVEKPKAKTAPKKKLVEEAALFEGFDGWGLPTVIEETSKKSIKVYYEVITPESAAEGDAAERGEHDEVSIHADEYDLEDGKDDAVLAAEYIKKSGPVEASSSNFYDNAAGVWYTTIDPERDYQDGSETYYSFHLKGFSEEEEKKVFQIITGKSESSELDEMARKVTDEVAAAFKEGKSKKVRNTHTNGKSVFLHGNEIVKKDGSKVMISDAGWPTVTTRERINGVLGALGISAKVSQKAGKQMVNGKEWDGKWMEVGSMAAEAVESVEAPAKKSAISREAWMKKHGKTEEAVTDSELSEVKAALEMPIMGNTKPALSHEQMSKIGPTLHRSMEKEHLKLSRSADEMMNVARRAGDKVQQKVHQDSAFSHHAAATMHQHYALAHTASEEMRPFHLEAAKKRHSELNGDVKPAVSESRQRIRQQIRARMSEASTWPEDSEGDHYNYYLVHKQTGALHGGFEYKQDAVDASKDMFIPASDLKITHRSKVDSAAKEKYHRENKIMRKLKKVKEDASEQA